MAEGDRVRLSGLHKTPQLNGEVGTVAGRKADRLVVVLDSTGTVRTYTDIYYAVLLYILKCMETACSTVRIASSSIVHHAR